MEVSHPKFFTVLPHHQFIGLLQILRRDGGVQLPRDIHGPGAIMLDIARRAEIRIRRRGVQYPVRLKLPDEQQHPAPLLPVMDVPLSGSRVLRRRALALPMEQLAVDGVVVVHGGRRIVLVCLVERHKEHIQILLRQPLHTLAHSRRFHEIQRQQDLVAGICTVQVQGAVEAHVHRRVDKVDVVILILQKLHELAQHDRRIREGAEIGPHLLASPILRRFQPDAHIEHLHHALLDGRHAYFRRADRSQDRGLHHNAGQRVSRKDRRKQSLESKQRQRSGAVAE